MCTLIFDVTKNPFHGERNVIWYRNDTDALALVEEGSGRVAC